MALFRDLIFWIIFTKFLETFLLFLANLKGISEFLEFMLLTRFKFKYERSSSWAVVALNVLLVAVAVAEAVNVPTIVEVEVEVEVLVVAAGVPMVDLMVVLSEIK